MSTTPAAPESGTPLEGAGVAVEPTESAFHRLTRSTVIVTFAALCVMIIAFSLKAPGQFNTWYTKSTDGGATWSAPVKLSNLTSGPPYKHPDGYTFTDGDYFGIAVSSTGVAHIIWGEADGSSLYCCGDTWYTKGS